VETLHNIYSTRILKVYSIAILYICVYVAWIISQGIIFTLPIFGRHTIYITLLKVGIAATLGSKIFYSSRGVWITRRVTVTHRELKEHQVCEGTNLKSSHS